MDKLSNRVKLINLLEYSIIETLCIEKIRGWYRNVFGQ